jgi:hypothetical protein
VANNNGSKAEFWKTGIQVLIVVFQSILLIYGHQIKTAVADHESRIDALELFAGQGGRWSLEQQRQHEIAFGKEVQAIWEAISDIKVSVAQYHGSPSP